MPVDKIVLGGRFASVNVRREPRDGDTIIGSLPAGVTLEVVGEQDGYYRVAAYVRKDAAVPFIPPSKIPWVSQVASANSSALTRNDCQQACLSMVFAGKTGINVTPDQITKDLQIHPSWYELNGNWVPGNYTTVQQGVAWLKWRGINAARKFYARKYLPTPGSIVLVNYSRLNISSVYDKSFYKFPDAYHFVVFLEGDDDQVVVHDPLWPDLRGSSRQWTREEWNNCFTGSSIQIT